ncbi:hypothetical protein TrRE_jg12831 [Triparma retinervis]|uniref:Uncharacterized protein n=1 Tax=Triparma retinervis TaxID=2557542 RepID=A0A9W7FHA7_9STRA|nr:hypothetical protein TrRE_jg12831 [Triparma retinervis]
MKVIAVFCALLHVSNSITDTADEQVNLQQREKFRRWQGGRDATSELFSPSTPFLSSPPVLRFRGGDAGCDEKRAVCTQEIDIDGLISKFGEEFHEALKLNEREHKEDCEKSCETFYCGGKGDGGAESPPRLSYTSYSMGSVPPEDFANEFKFPLDLIKVTDPSTPLITPEEASSLIKIAESEGVLNGEYVSGKYKLGGDWLDNLPRTRSWFNSKLEVRVI